MAAISLSTLPSELLLRIFRPLIPTNAHNNSEKADLQNLRLTCRALNRPATKLFFESWPILLWRRDNSFEPTESFILLRDHSPLAALVKDVVIKSAVYSDNQIMRLIRSKYIRWHMFDFAEGKDIAVELQQRFSVLPNIQRIGFQMTSLSDVQFSNTFLKCMRVQGQDIEEDSLRSSLMVSTVSSDQARYFPFHFPSLAVVLGTMPPKCRVATLEVELNSFPRDFDVPALFKRHTQLKTRLASLCLVIKEKVFLEDTGSSRWCDTLNRFESLTQLEINVSGLPLTGTTARSQQQTSSVSRLLLRLRLPNVRHLTLSRCLIRVSDFRKLCKAFPNLEVLKIENVAIIPPTEDPTSRGRTTWFEIAQDINRDYNGRCTLSFGSGPIFEIAGELDNVDLGFSFAPNWAITRTLKTPVLEILTTMSHSERPDYAQLQYKKMIDHTPPSVMIKWVNRNISGSRPEVDTIGITYAYYRIVYDVRPGNSIRDPPPGVHPLDWH